MKPFSLFIALSVLLCGCARKSELAEAREDLAVAQRKIEALENERVPKTQYDSTQASLKIADERIATLERELTLRQEQIDAQEKTGLLLGPKLDALERPVALGLVKGGYVLSNDTHVYTPDALLNFGNHLLVSSPTGLMVSDPDQKIVGGDLNIKTKDVLIEASDGLLRAKPDGSVEFTGKTLTMKFENQVPMSEAPETPAAPVNASTSSGIPAASAAAE
jgi:hypothetical protein